MKTVLLTSSILIVLTAALRPWLRGRIDPRAQYALWLAVALRLLIPVNFARSAYSAPALLERAEEPARFVEAIGQTTVPVPGMSYEDAYDQALREYHRDKTPQTSFTDLDEVERRARELQTRASTLAGLFERYARPVWLGGAAVTALWFALVNLRLRRLLRDALPVETDCPLPVYVSGRLPSPCLCGAVRPTVYVTPAALESPDRLRHVLTHELTHCRHKDHWWALVRCLCLCVYWFDPLVWWAAALSRQDCELACDEGAIRRLGEGERIPYGRTLVDMIAAGRTPLLQTATTMTGGRRRVRERIRLIADRPKTVAAVAAAVALIVGCAVGCTFTGAPEGTPAQKNLSVETIRERLLDVPKELKKDVVARTTDWSDAAPLVSYWMNRDWERLDEGLGWLLSVDQLSYSAFMDASLHNAGGWEGFARSGDTYYAISYATDVRYYTVEDAEPFHDAFEAIREYAMRQVLATEGVEPIDPPGSYGPWAVMEVMEEIACAPGTSFVLYCPGNGLDARQYRTEMPPSDYWSIRARGIAVDFKWEELTVEQAAGLMEQGSGVSLLIAPSGTVSSACITVYEGSQLAAVRTVDNEMAWYQVRSWNEDEPLGVRSYLWPGPYEILRQWYDDVELDALRSTTVPDRGQSHEEIVREWTENWEGALTKTSPGSAYACTYVRTENIQADFHGYLEEAQLNEWVQSWNLSYSGADYGKTWFTFGYDTVFVPADENTSSALWVGNTGYYEGGGTPEGALFYMRRGYMHLTDEGWTCGGVGTGF